MNENARLWVEVLESGEFTQTTGSLRHGNSYCCLGVACEVYRRETGDGEWVGGEESFSAGGDTEHAILPRVVQEWLGLRYHDSAYNAAVDGLADNQLTADNDSGKTFTEIAEIIRKYESDLFRKDES